MADKICCSRLKSALLHEQGELRRLARNASRREMKGLLVDEKTRAAIVEIKAAIAETEARIVDHDADHAGQAEVA